MKFLTFNMGGLLLESYQARLEALGRLALSKKPEFIALQNMTLDGIKTLRTLPWATRYNSILSPQATFENRKKPFCVIMSIYPDKDMSSFNYRDPESDRYLLWAHYVLNDKQKQPHKLTIATTELEIGKSSEILEKYLNQALFLSQSYEDCFIMGDLALVDDINGELVLNGNWKDAWTEANGSTGASGCTFDPPNNVLIKEKSLPSFRPDRLIYNTRHYKIVSVELVGTNPDQSLGIPISNHYGVLSTFTLLDNPLPLATPPDVPCSLSPPN